MVSGLKRRASSWLAAAFSALALIVVMASPRPLRFGVLIGTAALMAWGHWLCIAMGIFEPLPLPLLFKDLTWPKFRNWLKTQRVGLTLLLCWIALTLPFLGGSGLWDPWETHYGEVAREILARRDWFSLWSHQELWFWSKPIFIFWLEALALRIFGIPYQPGHYPVHAEWALRLPVWQ